MMKNNNQDIKTLKDLLFQDRERTNVLKKIEQNALSYLVAKIPMWITSNGLTAIGFFGSVITCVSFVLAHYISTPYLLFSLLGLFINWFGDSLDGRLAYYRNKPRKWFGFTLDLIVDWLGTILMGLGILIYLNGPWEIAGYAFVVLYGWSMIIAIHRYKITDSYSIDSGILGPTEVRIIIGLFFVLEVIIPKSLLVTSVIACSVLFIINISDTINLLKLADLRDKHDKQVKLEAEQEKK
jgi:phosphatidylglycerophosphate synthase